MTALDFPPNHPKFPSASILHAICAVGSIYTMAVPPTPVPNKDMGARMSTDNQLNNRFPNRGPFQMKYSMPVTGRGIMLNLSLKSR